MEENYNDIERESEIKKVPKRNIVLYLSIAVIMISLTFKGSYAFFTATVTGNDDAYSTVIESGDLQLAFANDGYSSKYIDADKMVPIEISEIETLSEKSQFDITNTGSLPASYKLYFTDYSITKNLINADFKWRLIIDGNTYNGTFYDLFNGLTLSADDKVLGSTNGDVEITSTPITIAKDATHECKLMIWLQEEDRNQIGLTEGEFSGVIKLVATVAQ